MLNVNTIDNLLYSEIITEPFPHLVIDNFFEHEFALKLESEFMDFDNPLWYNYDSPIEKKRTLNNWDRFPPATYQAFFLLCSH
jgi:hypothetical protein